MDQVSTVGRPRWREYSAELKAMVLEQVRQAGTSVAGVALSHGLNPNIVHQWMREDRQRQLLAALAAPGRPARHCAEDNAKSERTPRRQPLPAHLYRVEHHHEPQDTHCPTPGCGRAMVLVGDDVSEKLDIVPAELFVHRHIYGKWACRCCQRLVQEPRYDELLRNQGGSTVAPQALRRIAQIYRLERTYPEFCVRGI